MSCSFGSDFFALAPRDWLLIHRYMILCLFGHHVRYHVNVYNISECESVRFISAVSANSGTVAVNLFILVPSIIIPLDIKFHFISECESVRFITVISANSGTAAINVGAEIFQVPLPVSPDASQSEMRAQSQLHRANIRLDLNQD